MGVARAGEVGVCVVDAFEVSVEAGECAGNHEAEYEARYRAQMKQAA